MLVFVEQMIRNNEPAPFIVYYLVIGTIVMLLYTLFAIIKAIRTRAFMWEIIALLPFWIGWLFFYIVENIPSHSIGTGLGPFAPYEGLIFLAPIYIPLAFYALTAPVALLVIKIVTFIKKRRRNKAFYEGV